MQQVDDEMKAPNSFRIHFKTSSFNFKADDEMEQESWIDTIGTHIRRSMTNHNISIISSLPDFGKFLSF